MADVSDPRYVQVVPSVVDFVCDEYALKIEDRAVLLDLILRADWRTGRVDGITISSYAAVLGVSRRRLTVILARLAKPKVAESTFARGGEGTISLPAYSAFVRVKSARTQKEERVKSARGSRQIGANHESNRRERPAETSTKTLRPKDSDQVIPAGAPQPLSHFERFLPIVKDWSYATKTGISDDDVARCITACKIDCDELGADLVILDQTIGIVAEKVGSTPRDIRDVCGYLRASVRANARERLGVR